MRRYVLGLLRGVVLAWISGCSDMPHPVTVDARMPQDADPDAAFDAEPDAPIDTPVDAPSTSPRCASGATALLDVAPKYINNLAISGDVLYVATYEYGGSGSVTNPAVLAIDVTTGAQVAEPLLTTTAAFLSTVGTDVYAADGTQAWLLRPGHAPVAVVTNRSGVMIATADATHFYWAELRTTESNVVLRQSKSGGTVEPVMTCDSAMALVVEGGNVYCGGFRGLVYAPTTGGAARDIPYVNGYPIVSMSGEGSEIYFANLTGGIYRMPLPTGPTELVKQHPQSDRYYGLALTSDYFYVTGYDLLRIHRATLEIETVYDALMSRMDPVVRNDTLYFAAQGQQATGLHYVMRCAD